MSPSCSAQHAGARREGRAERNGGTPAPSRQRSVAFEFAKQHHPPHRHANVRAAPRVPVMHNCLVPSVQRKRGRQGVAASPLPQPPTTPSPCTPSDTPSSAALLSHLHAARARGTQVLQQHALPFGGTRHFVGRKEGVERRKREKGRARFEREPTLEGQNEKNVFLSDGRFCCAGCRARQQPCRLQATGETSVLSVASP